jgi:hypothetical protein
MYNTSGMKISDVPTLVAMRLNDDDRERIVRLAKKQKRKKRLNISALLRRGLESLEKEVNHGS